MRSHLHHRLSLISLEVEQFFVLVVKQFFVLEVERKLVPIRQAIINTTDYNHTTTTTSCSHTSFIADCSHIAALVALLTNTVVDN